MKVQEFTEEITDRDRELYQRAAKYHEAANLAEHLGISLAYAYNQYVKERPAGDFWIQVARFCTQVMDERMERRFQLLCEERAKIQ